MSDEREVIYLDVSEILGDNVEITEVKSMEDALNAVAKNEENN